MCIETTVHRPPRADITNFELAGFVNLQGFGATTSG